METQTSLLRMCRRARWFSVVAWVVLVLGLLGMGGYVYGEVSALISLGPLLNNPAIRPVLFTSSGITLIYLVLVISCAAILFGVSAVLNQLGQQSNMWESPRTIQNAPIEAIELQTAEARSVDGDSQTELGRWIGDGPRAS